jgi:hypothetical protein
MKEKKPKTRTEKLMKKNRERPARPSLTASLPAPLLLFVLCCPAAVPLPTNATTARCKSPTTDHDAGNATSCREEKEKRGNRKRGLGRLEKKERRSSSKKKMVAG